MERAASHQLSVSGVAWRFPDQALPPFGPQGVTPLRIFLVEVNRVDDTVGSKAAKILAQLAPRRQQPHGLEIADRNRPDDAFAVAAVFVAVAQRDLLAFMDMRARPRHVDTVGLPVPGRAGAAGG